jgi:hypothetical protein
MISCSYGTEHPTLAGAGAGAGGATGAAPDGDDVDATVGLGFAIGFGLTEVPGVLLGSAGLGVAFGVLLVRRLRRE